MKTAKYRSIKRIEEGHNGFQFILGHSTRDELQPIVFFDAGIIKNKEDRVSFPFHPHSGVGIISYFEGADLIHRDSEGYDGTVPSGGVQWIRAGGGIWHEEGFKKIEGTTGPWQGAVHQLWMLLPPELEESAPEYRLVDPAEVPRKNNVKVIVGEYDGVQGALQPPFDMTYLDISLKKGENFEWSPPASQNRGIIFLRKGKLTVSDKAVPLAKMTILEESRNDIRIRANEDAQLVLILAKKSSQSMVAAHGSIHSSAEAMMRSEERLDKIGQSLAADNRL